MNTESHIFKFEREGKEFYFCSDGDMPCLLFDKLKQVVKDFYKED